MTDITEHPTSEGKLYCCVVLDAWFRRVVGWSLDRRPTAAMVNSALGMAIEARKPSAGTLIHSDHGSQYTAWTFSQRVRDARLAHSLGSVGRRLRQRRGRVLLGPDANRAAQHSEVAHADRVGDGDLRLDWIEVFYNIDFPPSGVEAGVHH